MSQAWIVIDGEGQVGPALDVLGTNGSDVSAIVVGPEDLAVNVGRSVGHVNWIDSGEAPTEAGADAIAEAVAAAAPTAVVGSVSPGGRTLLGAIAARLDAPVVSDTLAISQDGNGTRVDKSDLVGRVIVTLDVPTPVCVLPTQTDAAPVELANPAMPTRIEAAPQAMNRVAVEPAPGAGSVLPNAARIVSVGRGLGSADGMGIVTQLASALQAEVACSMPVIDVGWVPADRYVGLSGQHVSPELYLALGISGAPQHLAGIRNAKVVVAINTDIKAGIFKRADYGILADLHQVVPELIRAVAGGR
ncbi:MAG: electron transfer flavoprotein subunit alpha/FixB family protein [Bifidobacteriaceae bacterium]|jgi:electron transfer flavoprotein alpha subunit|nr:electron transfer flavoprotein subunit alpha/FixB family protein [Bifidobacteriaceae bacterium]